MAGGGQGRSAKSNAFVGPPGPSIVDSSPGAKDIMISL